MNSKSLIWLIGMPGCGKSTVGKKLAAKMKKNFCDADDYFTGRFDMSPEEYINRFGEQEFRQKESEALKELSFMTDSIVACGGGVVERISNLETLKNSGIVIYIKRDLEKLETKGRPISKKVGTEALYERRHKLYEEWCDRAVVNDDIDNCVNCIYAT